MARKAVAVAEAAPDTITKIAGIVLGANGKWQRIDGNGTEVDAEALAAHPVYAGIRQLAEGGQELVEIPAFYVATLSDGDRREWLISAEPQEGFVLHPAFRRADGSEGQALRIGAYAASKVEGKAVSAKGGRPWTMIDFDSARAACADIGPGWRMWSIYDLAAVQLLMTIEAGGPDAQAAFGRGNVDWGGPVGGGESTAAWRGLCELWGNVWQMVDGLTLGPDASIRVWDVRQPGAWVETGIAYGPGTRDGFPSGFHREAGADFDLSLLFLPSEVISDRHEAVVQDWTWGHWGQRETVAYCGGDWSNGSSAGVFALSLLNARSNTSTNIGFRPAFVI